MAEAPSWRISIDLIAFAGIELRSTAPETPEPGRALDPAPAVDEHEHALRREVSQVDLRRAGADAAAVRRITEVAGRVVRAIDRGARDRQLLHEIRDRRRAARRVVVGADRHDRQPLLERVLADARAGDHDFVQRFLRKADGGGECRGETGGAADRDPDCTCQGRCCFHDRSPRLHKNDNRDAIVMAEIYTFR